LLQNIDKKKCFVPFLQNAWYLGKMINHGDNDDPNVTIIAFTLLEYIKYVKSHKDR
jgi:hypothetical protein